MEQEGLETFPEDAGFDIQRVYDTQKIKKVQCRDCDGTGYDEGICERCSGLGFYEITLERDDIARANVEQYEIDEYNATYSL